MISAADLVWVVGSGILLALVRVHLTATGIELVGGVAVVVLGFAIGQLFGIARAYRPKGTKPGCVRVCVEIRTAGDAETVWRNVADMGRISNFAPALASSAMRDGAVPGVGAVRDCPDRAGRQWAERCTRHDPVRREIEVEFLTDEPGFPFPFSKMVGGWSVQNDFAGTVAVRIWWEGVLRQRVLSAVVPALLAWQAQRQFAEVVRRMAAGESVDSGARPSVLSVVPC
jgi:hypothetical protein